MPVSEARKRANKKWDNANKERIKYLRYKSYTNTFIQNLADYEDLNILFSLLKKRIDCFDNTKK